MHIHDVHTDAQTSKHLQYTKLRVAIKAKRLNILTKTLASSYTRFHVRADPFRGVAADASLARPTSSLLPAANGQVACLRLENFI